MDSKIPSSPKIGAPVKAQGWASVTRGSPLAAKNGRRVTAEELERLQQVFLDRVVISQDKLSEARQRWNCSLIGKFLGRCMDSDFIARALAYKWNLVGDLEIIPLLEGFYTFWFSNEDDKLRV